MKSKKLFATIAISAMLFTGCTFGPGGKAIIKVNGEEITQAQFDKLFDKAAGNSMFSQMGMDVKKDKGGFLYLMIKDKVVNELIVKSLLDQEIEKRHIKVTKDDTDAELKAIIDKIGSKEKFNEILKQNGISAEQFKQDLAEEVKMKKLIGLISNVSVSDADVKKFYKENISKFKHAEKVRASHILISANPLELKEKIKSEPANKNLSDSEIQAMVDKQVSERLEKAKKVLAQVKKDPQSFAKVAKNESEDTASAEKGGDLGFFSSKEMVEPFSKAAFSQQPNTISDIVKTPYGFHIIMVTDRMNAGQDPFEKVKDEIKMYLTTQEQVKVLENLVESLKKQAKVEYVNPEYNPVKIQDLIKQQNDKVDKAQEEAKKQEEQKASKK